VTTRGRAPAVVRHDPRMIPDGPLPYDAGYGPLLDTRVRIATWNLWGRYGPWEARLPAIIETLRRVDADIVGLQEVWEDDHRSQASELAAALGYAEPVYAANLERDGARSGNAVLSRWPITRHAVRTLPREAKGVSDDEDEERLVVRAEVDGPRGPIQVFCAHLSWRADHSAIRQEQAAEICRFVRESRPRSFPAVVLGDLNADPDSDELRALTGQRAVAVAGVVLRDVWTWAGNADRGATWSNDNPFAAASLDHDRRIDHILVAAPKAGGCGQPLLATLIGTEPVDGICGSDHYGIVAELRY
jgi:endonuclease/exonuclease/phosphatase family metal-dependent hydrolase